jgi:hypothetical protein
MLPLPRCTDPENKTLFVKRQIHIVSCHVILLRLPTTYKPDNWHAYGLIVESQDHINLRPAGAVTGAVHPGSLTEYLQIRLDFSIDRKDHAPNESPRINRA